MSARRIALLQAHCPISVYNVTVSDTVYAVIINFQVKNGRLCFILRMSGATDHVMDPTEPDYIEQIMRAFRKSGYRVHPCRICFKVAEEVVKLVEFFSTRPFTQEYFRQCVSDVEGDDSTCYDELNQANVSTVFSALGILESGTSRKREQQTGPVPVDKVQKNRGIVRCSSIQTRTTTENDCQRKECVAVPLLLHCEDVNFSRIVLDAATRLLRCRDQFITAEEDRKCQLRTEIEDLRQLANGKRMWEYITSVVFTLPQPVSSRSPGPNRWKTVPSLEVDALQRYLDQTSNLNLKIRHAKQFACASIEGAYINACYALQVGKERSIFIPGALVCGENNQFLLWRSYCATEEHMRHICWNADETVCIHGLQQTHQRLYLASPTLSYGANWSNLRPHSNMALLVRACICSGRRIGTNYVIEKPVNMIPAFLVIFDT